MGMEGQIIVYRTVHILDVISSVSRFLGLKNATKKLNN